MRVWNVRECMSENLCTNIDLIIIYKIYGFGRCEKSVVIQDFLAYKLYFIYAKQTIKKNWFKTKNQINNHCFFATLHQRSSQFEAPDKKYIYITKQYQNNNSHVYTKFYIIQTIFDPNIILFQSTKKKKKFTKR